MKLLLDMNVPYRYSSLLLSKGFDSIKWSDIGSPDAEDIEIMSYARDNDLIVLTYDLDFSAILSTSHDSKPSVIQVRVSGKYINKAVDLIEAALIKYKTDLENGAIISIDINRARVRLLPL